MENLNFSIDIETLSQEIDAIITSIGIVSFNPNFLVGKDINSVSWTILYEELLDNYSYCVHLNLSQSLILCRSYSSNTLKFHEKIGSSELEKSAIVRDSLEVSLKNAENWISEKSNKEHIDMEQVQLWAKSPRFDFSILEHLYKQLSMPLFFNFRQEMDIRTIEYYLKQESIEIEVKARKKHLAAYDAAYQALQVMAFNNLLKSNKV